MGTATCHLICPPPFTPPCLHAGCSSYQAAATRTLPLSKGLSASSGNSPSATYLHGKPQPKLPQHTKNNMGWLAFCLPFYSISTWRMHVCGQLKLALWDLLSHSTLKTKAAGSSVEINLTWLATCLMQQPRLSWQPAAKPTKNCTAKSQAPQKNIFNTFNYEI